MSLQRIRYTTPIDRPSGDVFRWHERPGAMERMTPPWENIEILSPAQGITDGQRLRLRQKIGPAWAEWEVEHRGYVDGKEFRDVALRGPFAEWEHVHRIIPKGTGECTLEDQIAYRLPGGGLGQWLAGGMVRRRLNRAFAFRHARLVADLDMAAQYGAVRPMTFLISGASGLVGKTLIPFLRSQGHEVIRLVRHQTDAVDEVFWDPLRGELDLHRFKNLDAVIHLAGASIAQRWNARTRDEIWRSRVMGTRTLVDAISKLRHRPFVFVSASGIGFYGDRGDEVLDENAEQGSGFLPDLCDAWEAEVEAVDELGIRPVMIRTGMVLTPAGGALQKLLPLFRAGLGGRIGNGAQWMSWISIDDLVGAYYHAVLDQRCVHEVNAVAPEPVTNAEFTKILGDILRRPTIMTAPAPLLRAIVGPSTDELLLASLRVAPTVLQESDYRFRHSQLEPALRHLLGRQE